MFRLSPTFQRRFGHYVSVTHNFRNSLKDSYDYAYLLERCGTRDCLRKVHAQIITVGYQQNPFLSTKLIGRYRGDNAPDMVSARKVFDGILDRDVFLWNTVIQGYANAAPGEALDLYDLMQKSGVLANKFTFVFALKACAAGRDWTGGMVIHGQVVKWGFDYDVYVCNGLLAFYCKVGATGMSQRVFDGMLEKDIVSWNTMISGFVANGQESEALLLFHMMVWVHDLRPDNATLVCILPACARTSEIRLGFWIHSYILKSGMEFDAAVGSGLISTYATCGHIKIAEEVFSLIHNKSLVVWDAMIRCYGMHGREDEALSMFSGMIELGLCPDRLIFLCVLSICSHAGLVERGWEIFHQMEQYGVSKTEEHYACMVDLLGRAGLLSEALEVIESMPFLAGKDVYAALLGACRIHNNLELAEKVAEKLFLLESHNAGRYMLLAKMYEDAGRPDDEARMRKLLSEKKIRRPVGCSSVEIGSLHHIFGVEHESHPSSQQIFETLKNLEGHSTVKTRCKELEMRSIPRVWPIWCCESCLLTGI